MRIEQTGPGELTISGNIKSIEDSSAIKESTNALIKGGASGVLLKITDSFSMTSTVIGYLMKLVNIDKARVSLVVGDERLYQLLDELSLTQAFNVRQIGK